MQGIATAITRTKYLGYYFTNLNWDQFRRAFKYAQKEAGMGTFGLWLDVISSSYKYNIGLIDYFIFRFYEKSSQERSKWIGTGYKYEFDLRMNPRESRNILENKIEFYNAYANFIKHDYCALSDVINATPSAMSVMHNPTGKIVVKNACGQCGLEVEVLKASEFTTSSLSSYMRSRKFDLAEAYIEQHSDLKALSPSGLNTVRVMTMVNGKGDVDVLGARLRISVNSHVDNLASGNIAAPINLETGIVESDGVYSDITKRNVTVHPITGMSIAGFQVPFWREVMEQSKEIALQHPQNRGVGWDVAITSNGPDFVEGNHNWCKILYQIPVNQGLKHVLDSYS